MFSLCSDASKILYLSKDICHYSLLETKEALKDLGQGEILIIFLGDEQSAREIIPDFCRKNGYPVEITNTQNGEYKLKIEKTD